VLALLRVENFTLFSDLNFSVVENDNGFTSAFCNFHDSFFVLKKSKDPFRLMNRVECIAAMRLFGGRYKLASDPNDNGKHNFLRLFHK
jgi:hypothetical protein